MKRLPNQRWRNRRDSYRPPEEVINTREYEVELLAETKPAKQFILEHHYSGTFPATVYRFGMFCGDQLVGVATFGPGQNNRTLMLWPNSELAALELNRFTLIDDVPGNGETWFLSRCFEILKREGLALVVSFSDPVPRRDSRGITVFPGHVGTIYQSFSVKGQREPGGNYLGRSKPYTLHLFHDGRAMSNRAISKVRARAAGRLDKCQGWEYAVDDLVEYGVGRPTVTAGPGLLEWFLRALAEVTTPVHHPGNHKYAWVMDGRYAHYLGKSKPYPKWIKQRSWVDLLL